MFHTKTSKTKYICINKILKNAKIFAFMRKISLLNTENAEAFLLVKAWAVLFENSSESTSGMCIIQGEHRILNRCQNVIRIHDERLMRKLHKFRSIFNFFLWKVCITINVIVSKRIGCLYISKYIYIYMCVIIINKFSANVF